MLWHIFFWFFYPFLPLVLIYSVFKVLHMTFTSILIGLNDFIIHLDMLQDLIRVFFSCKKINVFWIHAKHQYHIVLDDYRVRNGVWQISDRMFCEVFQPLCNLWILTEIQSQLLETLSCFTLLPFFFKRILSWFTVG